MAKLKECTKCTCTCSQCCCKSSMDQVRRLSEQSTVQANAGGDFVERRPFAIACEWDQKQTQQTVMMAPIPFSGTQETLLSNQWRDVRCYWKNPSGSRTFFVAEQVSHHPPVSAFIGSNRPDGFVFNGSILAKSKFYGRGQTRFVKKTVKNDSFFNFFAPPEVQEDDDEMDEDTEALLAADFEIGHFFRERLIPKAVLYFTGEAVEDEFDDEEDEDMDGEGDLGDDDDDDDDPDYSPKEDQPKECKQQ